jgi:hypothetical protein
MPDIRIGIRFPDIDAKQLLVQEIKPEQGMDEDFL